MGTLHAIKLVVYTLNSKELQAFLEKLDKYFHAIPCAHGMDIRAILYKTCFVMTLSYERTGMGKAVKDEAILDYTKLIQETLIQKYPSFFIEFYMHHWHLRDYKKESHAMGATFLESGCLQDVCSNLDKYIDLSPYYYSVNEHVHSNLKDHNWRPGMSLKTFFSTYATKEQQGNPMKETNWSICQIEDD
jgi:hypothetical protein